MREAYNKFHNLAMLWSIGKDSTVMLWLAPFNLSAAQRQQLLHGTSFGWREETSRRLWRWRQRWHYHQPYRNYGKGPA